MAQENFLTKPHSPGSMDIYPSFPTNLTLVNSDASWHSASSVAGFGWVIEDNHRALLVEGCARSDFVSSPLMAETLALREAMIAAKQSNSSNVWIRSDNLQLIRAINSKSFSMELYGVLKDIEFQSSSFAFIFFSHIQSL